MKVPTIPYRVTRSVAALAVLGVLAGCVSPPPQVTRTTTTERCTLEQPAPVVSTTNTTIQRIQTRRHGVSHDRPSDHGRGRYVIPS